MIPGIPASPELCVSVGSHGGEVTSIIKVYTDVRLEGVYSSGLQVYKWVSFSHQKYINGVYFSPKHSGSIPRNACVACETQLCVTIKKV